MRAEILSIGTEILLGDIVNTNAQFLSKELAMLGIDMYYQSVVGDNENRILDAFELAFTRSDIVITSGGLGPTKDDLTKEVAAKYLNKELMLHKESLKAIEEYFLKRGKPLVGDNKKQAYFPSDAIVLPNKCGTAPGAIMENEGKTIIILPGPPKEMKAMFLDSVVPYLRKKTSNCLFSKTLRLIGIGEGDMAYRINDIIDECKNPTVAPYAKENDVIIRISAKAINKEEALKLIDPVEKRIRERLDEYIYGEGEDSLEDIIGDILVKKGYTISTAESCTGGLVAATLINYPGISKCFLEGAVTYSNEAKMQNLGVNEETLINYGAVSKECAEEMAKGIAKRAGTDIGISTTGIAGPGGGSEGKPVGLVYIGLYFKGDLIVEKCNFTGSRQKVRNRAVLKALDLLRKKLNEEK